MVMNLRSTIFPLLIAAPALWTSAQGHLVPIESTPAPAATAFVYAQPGTLPTGCAQGGHTGEGFPTAYCRDGSVWYQDMDGQIYENAAGNPVYAPGTWVVVE
jgi:hypothetical protein